MANMLSGIWLSAILVYRSLTEKMRYFGTRSSGELFLGLKTTTKRAISGESMAFF